MNSIWKSLLWKEWREYRLKMVVLASVLLLAIVSFMAIADVNSTRGFLRILSGVLLSYGFLAGFFLAMGVAAKENVNSTATFLHALPTAGWKPAAAKILMASLTAVFPILVTMAFAYDIHQSGFYSTFDEYRSWPEFQRTYLGQSNLDLDDFPNDYLIRHTVAAVCCTLSLLWWASALGVNRSDEMRAGAIAFLAILCTWLVSAYGFHLSEKYSLGIEHIISSVFSMGPGGPFYLYEHGLDGLHGFAELSRYLSPLLIAGQVGILGWFLYQFGRWQPAKTDKGPEVDLSVRFTSTSRAPFRSPFTAIVWKQICETGPLALFGLAGAIALSVGGYWIDSVQQSSFPEVFVAVTASLSFLVVMVAGIGLLIDELKPGVNDFWRSRPLDLRLWFFTKYFTGMIVLIACLGVPVLLTGFTSFWRWDDLLNESVLAICLTLFSMYVAVFSLTMLFQCLLRQPIYAAVLALGTLFLGFWGVSYLDRYYDIHWAIALTVIVLFWVGIVVLTWKAVRYNWGWSA